MTAFLFYALLVAYVSDQVFDALGLGVAIIIASWFGLGILYERRMRNLGISTGVRYSDVWPAESSATQGANGSPAPRKAKAGTRQAARAAISPSEGPEPGSRQAREAHFQEVVERTQGWPGCALDGCGMHGGGCPQTRDQYLANVRAALGLEPEPAGQ